jgi:hypothetical protein
MRRSAVIGAGLVFALQASILHAQARGDTILSSVRIDDTYFASTPVSLFRSNLVDQIWARIALPAGVSFGGCLYSGSRNSSIFYSPPVQPIDPRETTCLPGLGLWASVDVGATWTQLESVHFFHGLFAHPNGKLYAATFDSADPPRATFNLQVGVGTPLTSSDGGKTWEPIRGHNAPLHVSGFYPCQEEPTHVCAVDPDGSMPSPIEYAPEHDEWTLRSPFMSPIVGLTQVDARSFLDIGLSSGTSPCCYMLQATLANFYRDFPDGSLRKSAIVIRAAKSEYEFHLKGAQVVDVVMEILPIDPPLTLRIPDIKTSQALWGLKYIDADGNGHVVSSQPARDGAASLDGPRSNPIEVGKPFERQLDLRTMGAFDEPGVYRVALVFDNSQLPKTAPSDWTGRLSGTTFQVIILP